MSDLPKMKLTLTILVGGHRTAAAVKQAVYDGQGHNKRQLKY